MKHQAGKQGLLIRKQMTCSFTELCLIIHPKFSQSRQPRQKRYYYIFIIKSRRLTFKGPVQSTWFTRASLGRPVQPAGPRGTWSCRGLVSAGDAAGQHTRQARNQHPRSKARRNHSASSEKQRGLGPECAVTILQIRDKINVDNQQHIC